MSAKLPTISVTTHNQSSPPESSSDDESCDNDMDYNQNNGGGVTDVEDFDSQIEKSPTSRRTSNIKLNVDGNDDNNDVTDIEDYNDSNSDSDKSIAYPELKLSLNEFLQNGVQEQASINNDGNENVEMKAGNFLQAQNLNGTADYLTDCEDYNTESELENDNEKSVCFDMNAAFDEPGQVCIADATQPAKNSDDSDEYEDVSVLSDISDIGSAFTDATGTGVRGLSEDELLEVSGNEDVCQVEYSASSSDDDDNCKDACLKDNIDNMPPIDVTFITAAGKECINIIKTTPIKKQFLDVATKNDEVLTDVEGLDDSAAEDDSFDDDDDVNNQVDIPHAVILRAADDDGATLTEIEDMPCDENLLKEIMEAKVVAVKSLPPPHREIIILKEDKYGDTITNVMPMDKEFKFGLLNYLIDEEHTDSEDYSCVEELEQHHSPVAEIIGTNNLIESDITVSNDSYKPVISKRLELQTNAESVTDVEEIYVAGTNRRKKLKTRTLSKGKVNKLLDVNVVKTKEDGVTDVEDLELSEADLPPDIQKSLQTQTILAATTNSDKVTDIEDISSDGGISDTYDTDVGHIDGENLDLKEYLANSANITVTLETDKNDNNLKKKENEPLKLHIINDDVITQQLTDSEDIQLPSDCEDIINNTNNIKECNCQDLCDMLNESYTTVHDKNCSTYDATKMQLKGVPELRDQHTDVEYFESDNDNIIRANN